MTSASKAARIAVAVVAVVALVLGIVFLPLERWALALVDWVRAAGPAGVVVYALAYIGAALTFLPGSLLTAGAGFLYGLGYGTLLVSPVSVVAALCAFAVGRFVARGWIARRVANKQKFAAIDAAIAQSGFKIVLLLRLSPIFPFSLLNYALGLTRVTTRDFLLASFIGMLPGTLLYVYLGSLVTRATELAAGDRPSAGPWEQALYWGGFAATFVAVAFIVHLARRTLRETLDGAGASRSSPESEARA